MLCDAVYVYACIPVWICAYESAKVNKEVRIFEARVTGGCELSDMGARN